MTSVGGSTARENRDVNRNSAGEPIPVTSFTTTQKCCSRMGCSKYGLFVVNFLVWIGGGTLIGVGTWSRVQRDPVAEFDDVTVNVAYLLIGIGAVMFLVSLFGCLGALRESMCLLKVFVIAVVVVFVAQMIAGVLAFVMLDTVEDKMMTLVRDTIVHYHNPHNDSDTSTMDEALDSLQSEYSCCGGASYQDWKASPWYNCSSSSPTACGVPSSCCLEEQQDCGRDVLRYPENFAQIKIYTRGCIGALMSIFKDHLIMIGLIAFAVGFLQVCSLLMAHCLMRFIVTDGKFTL